MHLTDQEAEILCRIAYANIDDEEIFKKEFVEKETSLQKLATYLIKENRPVTPEILAPTAASLIRNSMRC